MARDIVTGAFRGSRKHGMNEGPLLAYREAHRLASRLGR